jgi:acetyl-CoA carboxylase carboxyl transferase subunit beta
MNWITNFVRPRIKGLMGAKPSSPDTLWHKCASCGEMIFHRDLMAAQHVCPQCGHHMRIGAKERFAALFDGAHEVLPAAEVPQDPLRFRDDKRYVDRLKENRAKTGQPDALVTARGKIGGIPAILAVQNFAFMGGSLGLATGAAFVAAARSAVSEKIGRAHV